MSKQNLKLNKGSRIAILGTNYKVTSTTTLNVSKCQETPKEEVVKGNHQSDPQPDRTKRIACTIIQKKIKALEQEETDALCSIDEDDVLFLFDGAEPTPTTSFSKQIERTTEIMDLKEILNQIQKI